MCNWISFPVQSNNNARWALVKILNTWGGTFLVTSFKEPEFSHFHCVVLGSVERTCEEHSEWNCWYNGTCHEEQEKMKLRPHGQTSTKIVVDLALINEWLPRLLLGGWWCCLRINIVCFFFFPPPLQTSDCNYTDSSLSLFLCFGALYYYKRFLSLHMFM